MNTNTPVPNQNLPKPRVRQFINFFKPATEGMRAEVRLISIIVITWALITFGFQFLILAAQESPLGESFITRARFIGFPFHYWFTGQFSIAAFVALCVIFSKNIEKIYEKHRK
ncbi:MAG: DUF4212 domain-containing protein [Bacillota bacterium]